MRVSQQDTAAEGGNEGHNGGQRAGALATAVDFDSHYRLRRETSGMHAGVGLDFDLACFKPGYHSFEIGGQLQ